MRPNEKLNEAKTRWEKMRTELAPFIEKKNAYVNTSTAGQWCEETFSDGLCHRKKTESGSFQLYSV